MQIALLLLEFYLLVKAIRMQSKAFFLGLDILGHLHGRISVDYEEFLPCPDRSNDNFVSDTVPTKINGTHRSINQMHFSKHTTGRKSG